MAVALVITGMVNYEDINPDAALANAFVAQGKDGYATLISAGAVAGLTTVVMTLLIGAVRVFFAMGRDGLMPLTFAKVNPTTGTPGADHRRHRCRRRAVASLTPIGKLEEMVNIGTLSAFVLVSIAVPILRKRRPDLRAVLPGAVLAVAALALRRDLRLPDAQPDRRDLAAVPGLDGLGLRSTSSTATSTAGSAGPGLPAPDYSARD